MSGRRAATNARLSEKKEKIELEIVANEFKRMGTTISMAEEKIDLEHKETLMHEVEQTTQNAFASIGRLGMISGGNSAAGRWLRAEAQTTAALQAKRLREAARLKALQRTPYPMVLARIKLLLEKLQYYKGPMALLPGMANSMSPRRKGAFARTETTKRNSTTMKERMLAVSRPGSPTGAPPGLREVQRPSTSPSLSGVPALTAETPSLTENGVSIVPLEKIMEELTTTFGFVSDFLKQIPEQARAKAVMWAKMENYKKDQDVYLIGEVPNKFYMILTGQVEVWTHPPGHRRDRTVIDVLKKGQCFGDHAIVNDELRTDCVTSTSNCSMLTVDRDAFLDAFGPYFTEKLREAEFYLTSVVDIFLSVPPEDAKAVIKHMMLSNYKAGREWEPCSDRQIYFIKSGECTLESHDHKFVPQDVSRVMIGDGVDDTPTMGDSGVLANVLIQGGRAVGTLGHEDEMRRIKKMMVPKKLLTKLTPGSTFGGGPAAMGDGDFQASLKVVAETDMEMYHMHIDTFMRHASPELMNIFRSDYAFKLTYYFGRLGSIDQRAVIGHPDALLQITAGNLEGDEASAALAAALSTNVHDIPHRGKQKTEASTQKRKKVEKKAHQYGQYSAEVQKALAHIQELKEGYFVNEPFMAHHMDLIREGTTPVERFWVNPSVSKPGRGNAIIPLLNQVYPEGMAPLGFKIDELVDRSARHTQADIIRPSTADLASPSHTKMADRHTSSQQPPTPMKKLERILAIQQHLTISPVVPKFGRVQSSVYDLGNLSASRVSSSAEVLPEAGPASSSPSPLPEGGNRTPGSTSRAHGKELMIGETIPEQGMPLHSSSLPTPTLGSSRFGDANQLVQTPLGSLQQGKQGFASLSAFQSPFTELGRDGDLNPSRSKAQDRVPVSERFPRVGALTAAGVIWERSHGDCTPLVRQVLTFEEMAMLKAKKAAEKDHIRLNKGNGVVDLGNGPVCLLY
ncbi:hypothetical protein CEUSTIGMA_g9873.t1 [Chlamydomonas eustigma]|uniref:Cyclic nucleotide-binding domain-containing protein n=1 Tax=Chlamydomonas eustigma TaxID=1157962 RepID=A0A250XH87_9CHLO|nr:hypothetical protein CEUSTIGMA_g9873.t1 [Chlamydomonas eustigma]|eukprot:GAX82445.1 hypothetical protein CEUSTIGMA_g9873.t1 [Chlamydomonas eustigma]